MPNEFVPDLPSPNVSHAWDKTARLIPVKEIGIDPNLAKRLFATLKKGAASVGLTEESPIPGASPTPTLEMAARLLTVTPPIVCAVSGGPNSPLRYSLIARFHQMEMIHRVTAANPEHPVLCVVMTQIQSTELAQVYADAALSDRLLALHTANRTWNLKKLASIFTKTLDRNDFAAIIHRKVNSFESMRAEQNKAAQKDSD